MTDSLSESFDSLDLRGLLCPLPVLRSHKYLKTLDAGQKIWIWISDPQSLLDMPDFCAKAGHVCLDIQTTDDGYGFFIQRGL